MVLASILYNTLQRLVANPGFAEDRELQDLYEEVKPVLERWSRGGIR